MPQDAELIDFVRRWRSVYGQMFTPIIGKVVDHFSYVPVFVAAGIMPLIALSFILRMVKPIEPSSGA